MGPPGDSQAGDRNSCCHPPLILLLPLLPRAVQKLSLASKRKKPHPPPPPATRGASTYPTDFSGVLQLWPPPAPPCLLRAASKTKDNPGSIGKVDAAPSSGPWVGRPGESEKMQEGRGSGGAATSFSGLDKSGQWGAMGRLRPRWQQGAWEPVLGWD